ncbi:hypothetical protein ACK1U3_17190 [Pseudomonas promysalinigenes]|uniref:hypothetical protein n=1 Tax=Pseudomonas promysalinigenes TaxID=485898 RepID=UPI003917095D
MTIIKNTLAIRQHPLTAIDGEVGDLILQAAESLRQSLNLKSFVIRPQLMALEAYCDVMGHRVTMDTLRCPEIQEILEGFTTAMAGQALIALPDKESIKFCRTLYKVLDEARAKYPDHHPLDWDFRNFKPDQAVCAAIRASASEFHEWYWKGWDIQQPRQPAVYLRLAQLVAPYGRTFVQDVYDELLQYFRNRTGRFRSEWNVLFDYLAKRHRSWPLSRLKTEAGLKHFMQEFSISYFSNAKEAELDARSQIKNWNRFLNSVEQCLCKPTIWASISSPIRRPPPDTKHGSETKVVEDEEGTLVQEKLLTNIPLHVTDAEAVEILFFHIKRDVATVRNWAMAQAADLKSRYEWRIEQAKNGATIKEYEGKGLYKTYTVADICATLEDVNSNVPTAFLCKTYNNATGSKYGAPELANTLGFAVAGSLFPFQCLLVLEHPEITTEFLKSFELYNQDGQLVGFDEEKRQLRGYKDRKQPEVREQIIDLNDQSFAIVKNIIAITSLGRRTLKAEKNDDWRYLFITSGKALKPFQVAQTTKWNDNSFTNNRTLRDRLLREFRPHSDLPDDELVEFIKRVRLTRIRPSRAVEIFIQSKSSEKMSDALGHEHYYPDLLSHYLPDAIMAFIKARWIRIFQKALVCVAMEESPHLLRVTKFTSIDELDTFLENHRIKEIPREASDPERKAQREEIESSEAVLSIGVPFLASLLSLEAAVKAATNRARVCGKAEYWASIAEKIQTEITSGRKGQLKKYLATALEMVDATKMEALIYA